MGSPRCRARSSGEGGDGSRRQYLGRGSPYRTGGVTGRKSDSEEGRGRGEREGSREEYGEGGWARKGRGGME